VRLSPAVLLALLPLGCGGADPPGDPLAKSAATSPQAATAPSPPPGPKAPTARDRLQGTWEIVRYESDKPIPDEAMPIMGTLFNALRLTFEGSSAIARIDGSRVEERAGFGTSYESGDEFTLVARGFMFDGATCRFTADGQIQVKDVGDKWSGLSTLRRVP
jgi:hypothetical protein